MATSGQVIDQLKQFVNVKQLEAIYKTGEGTEWYITFLTPRETELLGDGRRRDLDEEGSVVYFDRIDKGFRTI